VITRQPGGRMTHRFLQKQKIQAGGATAEQGTLAGREKMTYVRTAIWSFFALVWLADCTTLIGQAPDGALYLRDSFQFTPSVGHLVLPPPPSTNPAPRPPPPCPLTLTACRGCGADAVVVDAAHCVLLPVCPVLVLDVSHVRALAKRRVGAHADVHLDLDRQPLDGVRPRTQGVCPPSRSLAFPRKFSTAHHLVFSRTSPTAVVT